MTNQDQIDAMDHARHERERKSLWTQFVAMVRGVNVSMLFSCKICGSYYGSCRCGAK